MTPAEQARLIDKQEFEAECRAIRERVFAKLNIRQFDERQKVEASIARPVSVVKFNSRSFGPEGQEWEPKPEPKPKRQVGQKHVVAGRALTRRQWAEKLGINYNALNQAVHRFGSVEAAVLLYLRTKRRPTLAQLRPGVVSNFEAFEGTGAGSFPQEISQITFSEKATDQ